MKIEISPEIRNKELEYCKTRLKVYNISFSTRQVLGKSRLAHINGIRSLIAVILRNKGYSYSTIGSIINRDHATAMHLVSKYETKKIGRIPDYTKIRTLLTIGNSKEEILLLIDAHLQEIDRLQKRLIKLEKKSQNYQNS